MKNDLRGMKRREFARIQESKLRYMHISTDGFSGYAGLMDIIKVTEEWKVRSGAGEAVIADDGFTWLQLSPDEGGWWLTVMYDRNGELVQYYFDITSENHVDAEGVPCFTDMYLDIVLNPSGEWVLLDRDELEDAYTRGEINSEEYTEAISKAEKLVSQVDGREAIWRNLCARAMGIIKSGGA